MTFIHNDFLLSNDSARKLYHEYAYDQPIIDYHCHLPPEDIATDRQFANLAEIWLEGDHYKWRAMRANGVAEDYCTGNADPKEKFLAWAKTVPATLRNPLYHWTHLELKRYFGIDALLNENTADEIWEIANAQLATEENRVSGILKQFKVKVIGTTDDPGNSLDHHKTIASSDLPTKVVPSFRPDAAFKVFSADSWNHWVDHLANSTEIKINDLDDFLSALSDRIEFFDSLGCKASDHGFLQCPAAYASETEAKEIFAKARKGKTPSTEDSEKFFGFTLLFLGQQYAKKGWAMQLHLGALRNANDRVFETIGPDVGCDSIADASQIDALSDFLGKLDKRNALPKTILYNLNPSDNYAIASMCGNYFEEGVPGKMQFGSGWWFLDQLEGMTLQINALSNLGLLRHFVGMLTDSRSFMSYPRHEYFRRLLCDLLGKDIEAGLLPKDLELIGQMVSDICYANAKRYFGF